MFKFDWNTPSISLRDFVIIIVLSAILSNGIDALTAPKTKASTDIARFDVAVKLVY